MFMLGDMGESPESDPTPAIARFVNVEPSAALNAPLWPTLLMTLATTSSAVISPFRMFTLAALEVLCAPASAAPISPDVMLLRKSDDSAPATLIAPPSASASAPSVPETAGSTAIGDWALEPSGVLTYVLYAWPPTDWALPAAASPATSPTTSPRAARRFTRCMLLPFISHSFLITGPQCAWMVRSVHDPCSTMLPPVTYVRPVSPVGPVSPERMGAARQRTASVRLFCGLPRSLS